MAGQVVGLVVRRMLQALVVALGVATAVFVMVHLLPGDQARAFLGQVRDPQLYALYDQQNGLTQPLPVQYFYFLLNLLHGRLAFIPPQFLDQPSFSFGPFPVDADLSELVTGPLPKTLLLIALGYGLALAVGVPAGAYLALRHGRGVGRAGAVLAYAVYATPTFFAAIVLIGLLSTTLRVLPVSPASWLSGDVLADPLGLVLPVLTLALADCALITRYLQSTIAGVLVEDYVRTARAKGGTNAWIIRRHVMRNSLLPLISLMGLRFSAFLAIDSIVEYVFAYPGIGNAFLSAALGRDFYTLLGIVLIAGIMSVLGSLLADLGYMWADPRVRVVK